MLSTPKKLLLIGLSALVPAVAQATFIKNDVWSGGKTGAGLFDRNELKTDFSRDIDFSELFNDWQKASNKETKQATKKISQLLRPKKSFDFDLGGDEFYDFLSNKGKKTKRKNKTERSISVPEPGTMALLALGLAGLGVSRRGEQQRSK